MAKNENATLDVQFKHNFTVDPDGTVWYDAPVQIRDQADLANYHIQWSDCRKWRFGGGKPVMVHFVKVRELAVAEFLWKDLNYEHWQEYAAKRCMVPGTRKDWIRCPSNMSCAHCPYGNEKKRPVISLDGLVEVGYEPGAEVSAEEKALYALVYREIRNLLDAKDPRLAMVLEAKVLDEKSAMVIAKRLGVKTSRVYKMLDKIREIGEIYKNS